MIANILSFLGCKKQESNFGSYEKPKILEKLESYQNNKKANWENLEFWIDYDIRYSITPIDVIPFASTGNNGIHFGFLTDFGLIKDLNKAPIVSIASSYDPPINIIAKDIRQFLSFVVYAEQSSLLADTYKNDKALELRKIEYLKLQMEDKAVLERKNTIQILKDTFGIEKEDNIISKTNLIKNEREKAIGTKTSDGIGIKFENNEKIIDFEFSKNSEKIKVFLENSTLNSRLKFYREATFQYILSDKYDKKIKQFVIDFLKKDRFKNQSKILSHL